MMELQRFTIIGGDGERFLDGDVLTIEGVYDWASLPKIELAKHRLSRLTRWFRYLPSNLRWSIYLHAQQFANWLDPDRE